MTSSGDKTTVGRAAGGAGRRWNPWRIAGWSLAGFVLVLPLVAGAPWTWSDYVFAAVLILSVGLPIELVVRKTSDPAYRAGVGAALAAAFLIVWLTGAVGIIGSEAHPANLLYLGVLALGVIGALAARFRPRGLARVMEGVALSVVGIAVAALVAGWGSDGPVWPWEVVVLNGFFAALFAGSAMLFRQAASAWPPAEAGPEGRPAPE
jgi:hypothetical protein